MIAGPVPEEAAPEADRDPAGRWQMRRLIRFAGTAAALAWLAFLTYRFAADARHTAIARGLLGHGHLEPVFALSMALPAAFVVIGVGATSAARRITTSRMGRSSSLTRPGPTPARPEALEGQAVPSPSEPYELKGLVGSGVLEPVSMIGLVTAIALALSLTALSGSINPVLAFAFLTAWCWLTGAALLSCLPLPPLPLAIRSIFATGLGVAALSFAVLALALADAISDVGLAAILIAGALAAILRLRRQIAIRPRLSLPNDPLELAALLAVLTISVLTFCATLAPQSSFDALHYHLAMPRAVLDEGRFVTRPDIIQGYLPLGLEMTYVPALRLGGETAAGLIHWLFSPLTAALLWSAGDRFSGRPSGAIAAALFALVPLAAWDSTTASSDLALTFYLAAALFAIALFFEAPSASVAALAGLFCGIAIAFKIVAAIYLLPLVLLLGIALWRRYPLDSPRGALAFLAPAALAGAPWLVLRWIETGNPVLPFYNNVFRSDLWPPVNERFDLYLYGIGHGPRQAVEVLWQASLHPSRFGQAMPPWSLGLPFLACLALIPMLAAGGSRRVLRPAAIAWSAGALLCLVAWFLGSQYHRYALPAVAMLSLPAGAAIVTAVRAVAGRASSLVLSAALVCWLFAAMATFLAISRPDTFPTDFLLGKESPAAYRERVVPDYLPIAFLNPPNVTPGDKGLIYGYPYNYFSQIALFDTNLPATISPGRRIAEEGRAPDETAAALVDAGFRWLVVDRSIPIEDQQYSRWLLDTLLVPAFAEHLEVAYERYGVTVYRIRER